MDYVHWSCSWFESMFYIFILTVRIGQCSGLAGHAEYSPLLLECGWLALSLARPFPASNEVENTIWRCGVIKLFLCGKKQTTFFFQCVILSKVAMIHVSTNPSSFGPRISPLHQSHNWIDLSCLAHWRNLVAWGHILFIPTSIISQYPPLVKCALPYWQSKMFSNQTIEIRYSCHVPRGGNTSSLQNQTPEY